MPLHCLQHRSLARLGLIAAAATLVVSTVFVPDLQATTYWVAPAPRGDDANPGSRERPWASPHKAADSVAPGDTVYFREGVYVLDTPVEPRISGTEEAWITFAGYPGEHPVFDGTDYKPDLAGRNHGLLHVESASYLRLRNLHIRNSHGFGFMVRGPASHVDISECSADETFGPGIGLWNCEYIKVLHCELTRNNTNRMRLHGNPRREAIHEAISSGGARYFEIAYNHVHHGDKEGIDIKEKSAHGSVHHNYVHDMPRQGLYADAWFGVLEDVEFHHNIVHDCEWGMALSAEGADSEVRDVRIHHNLFYHNHGSGLFFALWGHDGPRRDIVIAQNTFYGNGSPDQFSGPTGNIDVRSRNVSDISIFNNLCAAGGTFEIGTFADPDNGGLDQLAAQNIRITHNFIGAFHPIDPAVAATVVEGSRQSRFYSRAYALAGDAPVLGDAGLRDPQHGSFYLTAASAARGTGLVAPRFGKDEPTPPDIGAFPFGIDRVADPKPVTEHVFEEVWLLVQSTVPGRSYRRLESVDGGKTWHAAAEDAVGNYIPDVHYFTASGSAPQFKYRIVDLGSADPSPDPSVETAPLDPE